MMYSLFYNTFTASDLGPSLDVTRDNTRLVFASMEVMALFIFESCVGKRGATRSSVGKKNLVGDAMEGGGFATHTKLVDITCNSLDIPSFCAV